MDVRFVVTIDVSEVESLTAAYHLLRHQLNFPNPKLEWETDDEFFIDGELGDAAQLSTVRTTAGNRRCC